jgi:hypothetical protein
MSIKTLVDQSTPTTTKPKIVMRLEFQAADNEHARKVDKLAKKFADELSLAMTGQERLPIGEGDEKPTKRGKKTDVGPNGEVLTAADKKSPGDFVPDDPAPAPGEIAAKGESFLHPGKDRPVARPAVPEPTGPLGEPVKA